MPHTGQPVVTATPGWMHQGADLPVPDNQTVQRIPQQMDPVKIEYGDKRQTVTADELERERQARLRPADKSVRAVSVALANVEYDTVTATARVAGLQDQVQRLLEGGGSIAAIQQARARLADTQVELDQLTAMAASLRTSLARAEAVEAADLAALEVRIPAAQAAVDAFYKFATTRYAKLAAEMEAGLNLEAAAEAAMVTLREAARRLGRKSPVDLPMAVTAGRDEPLRLRLCVPGYIYPVQSQPNRNPGAIYAP